MFPNADLLKLAKDAYSNVCGYRSESKVYMQKRFGYDMHQLKIPLKQEALAAAPVVASAA